MRAFTLIELLVVIAVVALLRGLGAPKRLGLLIEGESLLNDGTAIVVFGVFLAMATGHAELDAAAIDAALDQAIGDAPRGVLVVDQFEELFTVDGRNVT